ncbi:MAG: DNA-binding protein [Candidatus Bathyarchaeia archaeon]
MRRKRYLQLQKRMAIKENKTKEPNADDILNRVFKGRAWEVFNSASHQFPEVMTRIKELLVKLALSGEVKEITGEELYLFLVDLGLKVRLQTKIEFASHGEVKSLHDRLKEELRKT